MDNANKRSFKDSVGDWDTRYNKRRGTPEYTPGEDGHGIEGIEIYCAVY